MDEISIEIFSDGPSVDFSDRMNQVNEIMMMSGRPLDSACHLDLAFHKELFFWNRVLRTQSGHQ